ncbi:hypothetical protein LNQ81_00120 [Myroides sp. M-43]|uniref:hypothetical protein n=1 Tax=Myroides oncorhynchi TaxID=2893756 RepID=UPI001E4D97B4|nr:hypothetical protein [Myroides oncorhynchi]MCC9041144.1 hypothetical protein [Myroides oncorhynchi]
MPANKKHLETSVWQRILKITAGFVGGFFVSITLHLFLMYFFSAPPVFTTMYVTGYVVWAILFVIAFLFDNGFKIWLIYIGLCILFYLPYLIAPLHT